MNEAKLKELSSNWHEIDVTLSHYGRGPKKYGEGVYKFGAALSLPILLPPLGWSVANKARSYVYLKPPEGIKPPFVIRVLVPNEEQVRAIFDYLHSEGKTWAGRIGDWPAIYLHNHQYRAYALNNNTTSGKLTANLFSESKPVSSLKLGEYGVWEVSVEMRNDKISYRAYTPDESYSRYRPT